VLRNFIALRWPSPRPGFNARTLGPMAKTLTLTEPRQPRLNSYTLANGLGLS
jgi:hypothetical protein